MTRAGCVRRSAMTQDSYIVLDPTAGGGSIPFETMRMGVGTVANDLNPVAYANIAATVEWPSIYLKH